MSKRLNEQMAFLIEVDQLKKVLRQSLLTDGSRRENDAEHSWHLAMMAILLAEHANETKLDLTKVLKMVVIHDIVEIDAGDTFAYDEKGKEDKEEREQRAAQRIFGLLPEDQALELRRLWEEYERRDTAEARFAASLDRLQPLLHNFYTEGAAWKKHGVKSSQVLERAQAIGDGSRVLGDFAERLIRDAVARGYLAP
ncbi:MAG TPA: HD domain-containing protein [Bacillales bacterium]|nr:HD domain-containing protein [Bacillales bacterium]